MNHMQTQTTDVLVVGGGSGGFGAAIRAARAGARVTVIEAMDQFGGTSTVGGVNCWEPGIGGLGVHYELYARLAQEPCTIGVGRSTHFYSPAEPWGLSQIDPAASYESSLRRSATPRESWRRVHFEPDRMAAAMDGLLRAAGVTIYYRTRFLEVQASGRMIEQVLAQREDGEQLAIRAGTYIDCTGSILFAKAAGCATAFGEDGYAMYQEPSAPEVPQTVVNGVSLIFRVAPTSEPLVEPLPPAARDPLITRWALEHNPATAINEYPNGDLNMNVLPIMEGAEFHSLAPAEARHICQGRVYAHWERMQREYGFDRYRMVRLFPLVGVREGERLVGRFVLREQDVRAGVFEQEAAEQIIAFGDHALDTHGRTNVKGPRLPELNQPYGIPYSCLLPRELDNLLVASRGASFSHIAASSCRLSRTMLAIGEAAGEAAAYAACARVATDAVPIHYLRERLAIAQMLEKIRAEWPRTI
jgi:hypothetical protein